MIVTVSEHQWPSGDEIRITVETGEIAEIRLENRNDVAILIKELVDYLAEK